MDAIRGLGPGGGGPDLLGIGERIEEDRGHLGAPGIVDARKDHLRLDRHGLSPIALEGLKPREEGGGRRRAE